MADPKSKWTLKEVVVAVVGLAVLGGGIYVYEVYIKPFWDPEAANSMSCQTDSDCVSGRCTNGTCAAKSVTGDSCRTGADCSSGTCTRGTCRN